MTKQRLDGLDAVKLIAAAVVVLEHAVLRGTGGSTVAFFIYGACHVAVPTFFAVAGYIAGLKPPTDAIRAFAAVRARRLLIPAAFWMAFFPLLAYVRTGRVPWGSDVGEWLFRAFAGGGNAWFLVVLFLLGRALVHEDRLIVDGMERAIIHIGEPKSFSCPHYEVALA